jgi:competence protein ComEC
VVILEGCVVEPPAIAGERERFVIELEPGARAQVTLYSREDESLPPLRYGQKVEIEGRVRMPRNFGNPGAFDYERYLGRRQIYWTVSASAGATTVLPGNCGSPAQRAVMDLRSAALARIERLYRGNEYQTGMMQAILIGQSFQLQKVWTEQYRSTGTFHALVISGTHVAVLAAFFLFLLRICFIPEGAALLLTVAASWLYALVTGAEAPCMRSAAGLTLYTIGAYFYRERRIMNLLAAVALAFLLADPEQLFEPSFQLTFLAVGFIGAFGVPLLEATVGGRRRALAGLADTGRDLHLEPRLAQFRIEMRLLAETLRLWTKLPWRVTQSVVAWPAGALLLIYEVVLISAVVQIGLALPMVVYFHRVGMSGLSANALIVPLMGIVVPVGFIAVFTGWVWVAGIAGWLLELSRLIVSWHARIEPQWRVPDPPLWLGIALSAALICAALARGRWRALPAFSVAVLLVLLFWHPFSPDVGQGQLEMTVIDVGQGDSILLTLPDGKAMLVDGGGIPVFGRRTKPQLDIGEDVVAPYLWHRSIRRLDVLALSHAHEDHIGGLPAILEAFRPRELWTGATPESPSWAALRKRAEANGVRIVQLQAPRQVEFGGATVEVLAPASDYLPGESPRNNDSLVMRVCYGRHRFFLSGDIERQVEWQLLDGAAERRADVLKVPHHGSKTSTTEEFLAAMRPAFAIISVGAGNSYGHPHPSVLERLQQQRVKLFRTDLDGLVTLRSDGQRLSVEAGRWIRGKNRLLGVW